jgi:hypothetical protein
MTSREQRRAPRKQAEETIPVNDTIAGDNIGHIGNLSRSGLMLISRREPVDEAIYQFRMYLPDGRGSGHTITVGAQEQWHEPAATPGQFWAGFRIISIDDEDARALDAWLSPRRTAPA